VADDAVVAPGRARVRLSTASGSITVIGEARDDIVVVSGGRTKTTPSSEAGEVVLEGSSDRVEVRCPTGTDVLAGSASGDVALRGRLGAARVTTASGSIEVESVDSADLRTHSARIEVQDCAGDCRVTNKSGRVEIGRARGVFVKGVSGSIDVAGDEVRVRTVSGDVRIATWASVAVETVSGSVDIVVPDGFRPRVRSHSPGRIKIDVPQGDDGEIAVRTVSASVRVRSR
jgi:DUF4097 and DUF4098 domain-containing protein YvlB